MEHHAFEIILFAASLVGIFGATIFFGLKYRSTFMKENHEIRANDIFPSFSRTKWDRSLLIYGILKDFSATEVGLIVNDSEDRYIGKIIFHMATRRGWITIDTPNAVYEVDTLSSLGFTAVLHTLAKPSQSLCNYSKLQNRKYRYDMKEAGVLDVNVVQLLNPRYQYNINDELVGEGQHIGGLKERGRALILPEKIPIHIKLFIMSLQGH